MKHILPSRKTKIMPLVNSSNLMVLLGEWRQTSTGLTGWCGWKLTEGKHRCGKKFCCGTELYLLEYLGMFV